MRRHQSSGLPEYSDFETSEQVDGLIIIDRSVDWVTPMCTQLTYDGMLDEYIGINNGQLTVASSRVDHQLTSQGQ